MANIIVEYFLIAAYYLTEVNTFPVAFTAHVSIACVVIREDSKDLGQF